MGHQWYIWVFEGGMVSLILLVTPMPGKDMQNGWCHVKRTCDEKSCCCSCRPSLRSQERTVLSSPPVHSFEPSEEMSMHDAPSVCPWNCLTNVWLCKSHTAMLPSEQQLKHTYTETKSDLLGVRKLNYYLRVYVITVVRDTVVYYWHFFIYYYFIMY